MTSDPILVELRDRMRRVETRVTRFLESQGFDTGTKKSVWDDGVIYVPSNMVAIKDVLDTIPDSWDPGEPVMVVHGEHDLAWVYKPSSSHARPEKG